MEIVIKLSAEDLAQAIQSGGLTAQATAQAQPVKKRGRPSKAEAQLKQALAEVKAEEEAEDEEDEAPVKPAKKAGATKAPKEDIEEEDEEDEEEAEDEEDEEDEEVEEEAEFVSGDDLAKLKRSLTAFAKAKGSKDAAVKVLRKFAPSSERVKAEDLPKLLKALKV